MLPRDAFASRTPLVAGAGPDIVHPSRLRGVALLAPYVGILAGGVIVARTRATYFDQLLWLAPLAALAYLAVLSLAVALLTRRRRRAGAGSAEELELGLRRCLLSPPAARQRELRNLLPRLGELRGASSSVSGSERLPLRKVLSDLDARSAVELELKRTRRKWRRAEALFTLGWLGDERSIPVLRDWLRSDDPDIAYVAAQSLAELDCAPACACLVEALRAEWIARPLAAMLLEGSRFEGAAELIAHAREDPAGEVRSWVAYLVGRRRSPRAGSWLAVLAADGDAKVRASAAEALGRVPDAGLLAPMLTDSDWLVRANAAKAVGHAGLRELGDQLTPLLRDRVWWVRHSATLSLEQLGASSIELVRPLLLDEDRFARNKAAEVLTELGYVSEQIAELAGGRYGAAGARAALAAVARADGRATIEARAENADPLTRELLREVLDVGDRER